MDRALRDAQGRDVRLRRRNGVFESVYSEPGGYIGITFWATISWRDAQGAHQVASDIANCTIY